MEPPANGDHPIRPGDRRWTRATSIARTTRRVKPSPFTARCVNLYFRFAWPSTSINLNPLHLARTPYARSGSGAQSRYATGGRSSARRRRARCPGAWRSRAERSRPSQTAWWEQPPRATQHLIVGRRVAAPWVQGCCLFGASVLNGAGSGASQILSSTRGN